MRYGLYRHRRRHFSLIVVQDGSFGAARINMKNVNQCSRRITAMQSEFEKQGFKGITVLSITPIV